jgi:hypothetical protein
MYSKASEKTLVKVDETPLTAEEIAKNPNVHLGAPALITGVVTKKIEVNQTYRGTIFSGSVADILARIKQDHPKDESSSPAPK